MKKKPELPAAGTAFAFPLGDGRLSVCRVILDTSSQRSKEWGGHTILVACSSWIGDQAPRADNPALRPILRLNHHSWADRLNVLWVSDEPPQDMIPIGIIDPSANEQAIPCMSLGMWKHLTCQPLAQWRWDHERDTVLAEDVLKREKDAQAREKAQQERKEYLKRISLDELRERRFFPGWKDYPPPRAVRASRQLMTDTVQELLSLGSHASEGARMAVLQRCIEAFNALDARMQFIETVERENICEEFEAIVHACGLGHHEGLADEWRDW